MEVVVATGARSHAKL